MAKEADMSTRSTYRLVREGDLVAEVEVHLLDAEGGWAPYLSLDDAYCELSSSNRTIDGLAFVYRTLGRTPRSM